MSLQNLCLICFVSSFTFLRQFASSILRWQHDYSYPAGFKLIFSYQDDCLPYLLYCYHLHSFETELNQACLYLGVSAIHFLPYLCSNFLKGFLNFIANLLHLLLQLLHHQAYPKSNFITLKLPFQILQAPLVAAQVSA